MRTVATDAARERCGEGEGNAIVRKVWSAIKAQARLASSHGSPSRGIAASRPDDPFFDRKVQERVGALIAKAAFKDWAAQWPGHPASASELRHLLDLIRERSHSLTPHLRGRTSPVGSSRRGSSRVG